MKYKLTVSEKAIDFLAKEGYDEAYGARPLARAIQHYVIDQVGDEILSGNIDDGATISITFDSKKEELVIKPEKTKRK